MRDECCCWAHPFHLRPLSTDLNKNSLWRKAPSRDEYRNHNLVSSRITAITNGVRTVVLEHQAFLCVTSSAITSAFRHFREACKAISLNNTDSTALWLWQHRYALSRVEPEMHSTNLPKSGFRQSFWIKSILDEFYQCITHEFPHQAFT